MSTMESRPFTLVSKDQSELLDAAPPSDERLQIKRIFRGEGSTMLRLTFAAGQEMREHSTHAPLIVQVLRGDVQFSIGDDVFELTTGSILQLAPNVEHALLAHTEAHLLLTLCVPE